jgi:hypothetical protein
MALLYTIHVACVSPNESPDPTSPETQKALRSFGNWINCSCQCGRRWNFANSMDGLRDDHRRVKECVPGAWKDSEDPDEVQENDPEAPSLFKTNIKRWYAKQEYPIAV